MRLLFLTLLCACGGTKDTADTQLDESGDADTTSATGTNTNTNSATDTSTNTGTVTDTATSADTATDTGVSPTDAEARCEAVDGLPGGTCLCSETMHFDSAGPLPSGNNNPPNSVSHECNGGDALNLLNSADVETELASMVGGLDLPADHFVLTRHAGGGHGSDVNFDFTDGTYCVRIYTREGSEHFDPPPSGAEDVKGMILQDDTNAHQLTPHAQLQYGSGGLQCTDQNRSTGWLHESTAHPSSGDDISTDDCSVAGWCRMEMCFDHNRNGADRLQTRCRVTALGTDEVRDWVGESTNAQPTVESGGSTEPIRFLVDNPSGPFERHFAYIMTATMSPADESFWIGCSEEIEGAGCD